MYHMLWLVNAHHIFISKGYNKRNVTQNNHIKWPYNIWVGEPCNNVTKFSTGHWTAKFSVQAFPASFRFYHCSLWDTSLNSRKFNHRPTTTKCIAPSQRFWHKSDNAKPIFNKPDYINMNVITVTKVIILNYRYSINIIEQCVNLNIC